VPEHLPRRYPLQLAAIDAGVKTVTLPAEREVDVRHLPDYMRDKVEIGTYGISRRCWRWRWWSDCGLTRGAAHRPVRRPTKW